MAKKQMKYNDKSKNCEDWSTEKLKKETILLSALIDECFSSKDLWLEEKCLNELSKRGIKATYKLTF